jgi:hypothetical protein
MKAPILPIEKEPHFSDYFIDNQADSVWTLIAAIGITEQKKVLDLVKTLMRLSALLSGLKR